MSFWAMAWWAVVVLKGSVLVKRFSFAAPRPRTHSPPMPRRVQAAATDWPMTFISS